MEQPRILFVRHDSVSISKTIIFLDLFMEQMAQFDDNFARLTGLGSDIAVATFITKFFKTIFMDRFMLKMGQIKGRSSREWGLIGRWQWDFILIK